MYINLIIYVDYFDLDVCVVGDDFYMIVFSFGCISGLFIFYLKDLVNWCLVNYVLKEIELIIFFNVF